MAEGIGSGGGGAFLRAGLVLNKLSGANLAQEASIKIVRRALEEPLRQIVTNAGGEPSVVIEKVLHAEGNYGYNAVTGEYGDMLAMGVIDPTRVTRLGLQNAASIASLILTTDCLIAEKPKSAPPMPMGGGGNYGM